MNILKYLLHSGTWPLTEGACHLPPVISYLGEQILLFPLPLSSKDAKPCSKDKKIKKINAAHFINVLPPAVKQISKVFGKVWEQIWQI